MNDLFGGTTQVGWIALKAVLLYLTAVIGFRVGERRTLAEMSAFDFVAAVAVGAIVGRVPNASTTSYIAGATTLVTILTAHRLVSMLRQSPRLAALFDHPPRVLVIDGRVLWDEIRRAGLTRDDLYGLLRQHGIIDLKQIRLVVFEQRGKVSVIKASGSDNESELLADVKTKTHRSV